MKVLNLQCPDLHQFEGWFASEEDFAGQFERGLLECPICGQRDVHKLPSAPRLNLSAQGRESPAEEKPSETTNLVDVSTDRKMQAAWLQVARQILAQTEDVGERFAQEARRIHYGEAQERGIRGQASKEDTEALLDEGIAVMPLLLPDGLEGPVH